MSSSHGLRVFGTFGDQMNAFESNTKSNTLQHGGRRKRRTRKQKGGMWGSILNRAILPVALLGAFGLYSRRNKHGHVNRKKKKKTFKNKSSKRR